MPGRRWYAGSVRPQNEVLLADAARRATLRSMTTTTTATATTRTNIMNYMNAIQAGDEAALRDAFHPDATWWLPGDLPISRTWHGRDAILGEFLATVMARFVPGSLRFTTHAVAAD